MNQRIAYAKVAADGLKALYGLEMYVRRCGLERSLRLGTGWPSPSGRRWARTSRGTH